MNRPLKLAALLLSVITSLLLSQALWAAGVTDHHGPALETASVCISVPFAPHVSIARSALRELRERMARYPYPTGVCITGPFEQDCRAPESVEEAWLLEKLYGPPQRWVLDIVPMSELSEPSLDRGELFFVRDVSGISVGVLTTKTVSRLSVELYRDVIRVYELDA
jgi:hypothetical protein